MTVASEQGPVGVDRAAPVGVAGPAGGDRDEAFVALYTRLHPRLVRFALATTGSLAEAEELAQDAFTQLYRRWDDVREPEPWVWRATASLATSWVRRRVRERAAPVDGGSDPLPASTTEFLSLLADLTPQQRRAVFLRFHEDFSEARIAEVLGCRPGTVKSSLSRALATLRASGALS